MKCVWCASVIDQKRLMEGSVSYHTTLGFRAKAAAGSVAHIYRHEITIKSPKRSANEGCALHGCGIWFGLKHKWKEDACNRYITNPTPYTTDKRACMREMKQAAVLQKSNGGHPLYPPAAISKQGPVCSEPCLLHLWQLPETYKTIGNG